MNDFEITFQFNAKTYGAKIHRAPGYPITYLASIQQPHDLNVDRPIPFVAPKWAEMLGWINLHEYPTLGGIISSAIEKYSVENQFSLFK